MARQPRFILPGQPQHVIQRGNNRDAIFAADEDYQFYLEKLAMVCERFDCQLHAYVLMPNHVHLLMTPNTGNGIGKVMQSLGRYYVQYFNRQYQRTGTLWEGRYRSTVLDSEAYLMACSRYIELNPVRAGMVEHPGEYPWSSYEYNAQGYESDLVTAHALYLQLGNHPQARCEAYSRLFEADMDSALLDEIREATNKSWVLGSGTFKEQVETLTKRQASPKARGGDRKSKAYRDSKMKADPVEIHE
ncbi:transposase [Mariprofundus erugo]|uniref:Transposase n=1 Tax=Mariprofundus erugo TaxID=2528639 RepID=A0A5R9GT91_9PROT|nr:transposase [Mariprofundus erugo]TLS67497.1 transposase [Mariprofundus erugo]